MWHVACGDGVEDAVVVEWKGYVTREAKRHVCAYYIKGIFSISSKKT
jgi:hypothetical protein